MPAMLLEWTIVEFITLKLNSIFRNFKSIFLLKREERGLPLLHPHRHSKTGFGDSGSGSPLVSSLPHQTGKDSGLLLHRDLQLLPQQGIS